MRDRRLWKRCAAALAIALSTAACQQQEADEVAATCDGVEHPLEQGGGHLLGDQEPPEPYSSTPPTSGWHATGAFDIAIHDADDPLTEPRQVSVLEAGAVVVTYRDLPDADREALASHVADHHDGRVALTPYSGLDSGEVAFTAWGTLQRCDGVHLDALDAFASEHAESEPARPGEH